MRPGSLMSKIQSNLAFISTDKVLDSRGVCRDTAMGDVIADSPHRGKQYGSRCLDGNLRELSIIKGEYRCLKVSLSHPPDCSK
jgi:hypothetical protein